MHVRKFIAQCDLLGIPLSSVKLAINSKYTAD